jgi:hypothetical protein
MSTTWLVAIDDTDNLESIGTGRLARMLADHLVKEDRIASPSVTRHQLLVHPDVPYTSHNSSSCISAVGDDAAGDGLFDSARRFLEAHEHEGANPGLCVIREDRVPPQLPEVGHRAQREVLDLGAFDREVAPFGLRIWSRGETGQGRIGAVCGVALRSTGDDGRFIDLPGIRSVGGRITVGEILEKTGVEEVTGPDGEPLDESIEVETRDWIRPNLCGGRAVLRLRREGSDWVPVEKHSKDDG